MGSKRRKLEEQKEKWAHYIYPSRFLAAQLREAVASFFHQRPYLL